MDRKITIDRYSYWRGANSNLRFIFLIGLYLLIFISPLARGLYFQAELLPAIMVVAMTFLICIAEQISCREMDVFNHPLDLVIFLMPLAYILSLLNAIHMQAAVVELLKVSAYAMVYWASLRAVRSAQALDSFLLPPYLAAVAMAMIGLGATLGWIHWPGAWEDGHVRSTLQYHNALAIYLAALNLAGLALSLKTEHKFVRMAYAGGNYLLLLVILGSLSRGTWLLYPLELVAFVILIQGEYRRRARYQILLFLGVGLVAGRFFFNAVKSSHEPLAAVFLIMGLLLVMATSMFSISRGKLSLESENNSFLRPKSKLVFWMRWNRLNERSLKSKSLVGVITVIILLILYLALSHYSFNGFLHYVVPDTAIARADKLSLQDHSVQERLEMYRNAGQIIKDYPLTGVGGGGWQALYHSYASRLYWSNEVHSFYLKTWLEAGALGILALIAMGILFLRMLVKIYPHTRSGPSGLSIWAASLAVVIIVLHSLIDFELSMAAVGFVFFGLIGAVRGTFADLEIDNRKSPAKTRKKEYSPLPLQVKQILGVSMAALLALLTLTCSASIYVGSVLTEQGGAAWENQQIETALNLYQKASWFDPCQAACQVNLAHIKAMEAKGLKQTSVYNEALDHANKAAELEPYNPTLHRSLIKTYGLLGRPDLQIKEAQAAINVNPFLTEPYEDLASLAMPLAWLHMDRGERIEVV